MVYVDDGADEDWVEDDASDDDDVLLCPSCRKDVHEDTQQCPHCGDWITPVDPQSRWKRLVWVIVVVMMVLLLVGVMGL